MTMFQASRPDGRSDSRVLVELVSGQLPGTTFTYSQLREALQEGTDRVFTNLKIGAAVRCANRPLLMRHQRVLHVVPRVGYRLAPANEHTALATQREFRADRQIRTALLTLRNVKWDEMNEIDRIAHQAHLQVTAGIAQITRRVWKKQNQMNAVIDDLLHRVATLEAE